MKDPYFLVFGQGFKEEGVKAFLFEGGLEQFSDFTGHVESIEDVQAVCEMSGWTVFLWIGGEQAKEISS